MNLSFIGPLLAYAAEHYGIVGTIVAYLLLMIPVVTLLIEVAQAVVTITISSKDDVLVAKVKAAWDKILPVLEVLPHVNLPIAPGIVKIVQLAMKVLNGALAFLQGFKK